jgi:hypothetical protein
MLLGSGITAQAQFLWPGHSLFPSSGSVDSAEQRGSHLAARLDAYCRQPPEEVARKAQLRQQLPSRMLLGPSTPKFWPNMALP